MTAEGPKHLKSVLTTADKSDWSLLALAIRVCQVAATKCETGKCELYDNRAVDFCLNLLRDETISEDAAIHVCGLLGAVCVNDDETSQVVAAPGHPGMAASRAFATGRELGKRSNPILLSVLKRTEASAPKLLGALMTAVRKVSVNDECCQVFADEGGIAIALAVLKANGATAKPLANSGISMLRQLAANDASKGIIINEGGLEVLSALVKVHADAPGIIEQAIGTFAALFLRNPDGCDLAASTGCIELILSVMKDHADNGSIQRQGSMALRNMAARNLDLRSVILGHGAEELLRSAKERFKPQCGDVAGAALRDLGCDEWQ